MVGAGDADILLAKQRLLVKPRPQHRQHRDGYIHAARLQFPSDIGKGCTDRPQSGARGVRLEMREQRRQQHHVADVGDEQREGARRREWCEFGFLLDAGRQQAQGLADALADPQRERCRLHALGGAHEQGIAQ